MRRLSLCLAAAVGALVLAPAALADGPLFVTQGGAGVATRDGAFHYVAVPDGTSGTLVEKIEVPKARSTRGSGSTARGGIQRSARERRSGRASPTTAARSCSPRPRGRTGRLAGSSSWTRG